MPLSNTIEQYALVLKFDFLKIEFQCKTHFVENRVIGNKTFLKKNVELEFLTETRFLENRVSKHGHFARWFQNEGILLELVGEKGIPPFWPIYII